VVLRANRKKKLLEILAKLADEVPGQPSALDAAQ